jgi:hypothetical protein
MREYRKRKRLEDNCNNLPKRTKLNAEQQREYREIYSVKSYVYMLYTCVITENAKLRKITPQAGDFCLSSVSGRILSKSKLCYNRRFSRPVRLGIKHSFGAKTRSLLLSDSCRHVHVGRSLWREDGSVVCQTQSAVISLLSVCTICIIQVIKCMYIHVVFCVLFVSSLPEVGSGRTVWRSPPSTEGFSHS